MAVRGVIYPLYPPRMGSRAPLPPPCPASRRLACRDLNSPPTYSDLRLQYCEVRYPYKQTLENKGFPDDLSVKYVWEGRLRNNNVHIYACVLVVACGRCVDPPNYACLLAKSWEMHSAAPFGRNDNSHQSTHFLSPPPSRRRVEERRRDPRAVGEPKPRKAVARPKLPVAQPSPPALHRLRAPALVHPRIHRHVH